MAPQSGKALDASNNEVDITALIVAMHAAVVGAGLTANEPVIGAHALTADKTVTSASSALAAAGTAGAWRTVTVTVLDASAGAIRVAIGQASAQGQGEIVQIGQTKSFVTDKAVNAIRDAAADATVSVNIYTK
jgi:hypothetical protein